MYLPNHTGTGNEAPAKKQKPTQKASFSGGKLRNQLRSLIRSSRKSSAENTPDPRSSADVYRDGPIPILTPALLLEQSVREDAPESLLNPSPSPSQNSGTNTYDSLPPLPLSNEPITESLIVQAKSNYVEPRETNKAAPRRFHNTISHLRSPRHAMALTPEPEPHASPYYPHQHLTIVERHALRGLQHAELLRRRLTGTDEELPHLQHRRPTDATVSSSIPTIQLNGHERTPSAENPQPEQMQLGPVQTRTRRAITHAQQAESDLHMPVMGRLQTSFVVNQSGLLGPTVRLSTSSAAFLRNA
ncbi:unnamed protein product [Echinostoma caproni]|uniref:Uncharacterized protein n=1 Tax=Echinostoma caproni TaxID=27848 RepID=A0A183AJM0_9TREM|nr:unnamed protein product [Echinostoma caproni]